MKILIIKLGLSETLDPEIGHVISLGDVLRTTPVLLAIKEVHANSKITWLIDERARALVENNDLIDRVLIWDSFVGFQLMAEKFDMVINLEKIAGLCALANHINAWKKYGFRFDETLGSYHFFDGAEYAMQLCTIGEAKLTNEKVWQQVLIEMIGCKWKEQPYSLGYRPRAKPIYDIGFNHQVGAKFPGKAWSNDKWEELEKCVSKKNLSVSWQQGLANLHEYMEWIASCKMIVSSDSLGLHLALAFGIPVVGLFGVTSAKEVHFYGNSSAIQKVKMNDISVAEVEEEIYKIAE
jgi:heptosyltransferase II